MRNGSAVYVTVDGMEVDSGEAVAASPRVPDQELQELTEQLRQRCTLQGVPEEVMATLERTAAQQGSVAPSVFEATSEVIASQGGSPSVTSLFCGLLATLEQQKTRTNKQAITPLTSVHHSSASSRSVRQSASAFQH